MPMRHDYLKKGIPLAIAVPVAAFLFQVLQQMVDSQQNQGIIRWLFPAVASIAVILLAIVVNYLIAWLPFRSSPDRALREAVAYYARELVAEKQDKAMVALRNRFSFLLHLMGYHDLRVEIGRLAIVAATITRDDYSKAEILTDDLGWTNHVLGKDVEARGNLLKALVIFDQLKAIDMSSRLRVTLGKAKVLRHLAVIEQLSGEPVKRERLEMARSILDAYTHQDWPEVLRDKAQLLHAEALMIEKSLQLEEGTRIRAGDQTATHEAETAIRRCEEAREAFKSLGDLERDLKVLLLELRFHRALGHHTEADELEHLRDRLVDISDFPNLWAAEKVSRG